MRDRAVEGWAHLQVLGQSSWLQVEPVLIGPQLPPLHFLVMKFKLHLGSGGDVHFGFEVLHIEGSAPTGASPPRESSQAEPTQRAVGLPWASNLLIVQKNER